MIPEPVDDRRAPEIPSTSKGDAAEPPTVSNDEGLDGSGDGGVAPENDDATHDENEPRSDDDDDNEDDDDGGGGGGGNDQLISQRLTRSNRQPIRPYAEANAASRSLEAAAHRFDVDLTEPFMIYVGSGADRPNSLRAHAAKHGLAVVMVDKKVGGYEHDLTFGPVIDDLEMILRHSSCTGLFFSTLHVARGRLSDTCVPDHRCYDVWRAQPINGKTRCSASFGLMALCPSQCSAQTRSPST